MLNLTAILRRVAHLLPKNSEDMPCWSEEWDRDPLSHPVLQRMTLEELADLPFEWGTRQLDRTAASAGPITHARKSL